MRLSAILAAALIFAAPAFAGDLAPLAGNLPAPTFAAPAAPTAAPLVIPSDLPPGVGFDAAPRQAASDYDLYHPEHFGLYPAPDFGAAPARDPTRDPHDAVSTGPGYFDLGPQPKAYADFTFRHGAPKFTRDQGLSYQLSCGFVYHRFFDEFGAYVDRPVRVCN